MYLHRPIHPDSKDLRLICWIMAMMFQNTTIKKKSVCIRTWVWLQIKTGHLQVLQILCASVIKCRFNVHKNEPKNFKEKRTIINIPLYFYCFWVVQNVYMYKFWVHLMRTRFIWSTRCPTHLFPLLSPSSSHQLLIEPLPIRYPVSLPFCHLSPQGLFPKRV